MTPQRSPKKRSFSQTQEDDNDDFDADLPNASALKRPRSHKIVFHPDTVDNSLWADLNDAKRYGELNMLARQYKFLLHPDYKKAVLSTTPKHSRPPSPRSPSASSSGNADAHDLPPTASDLKDRNEFALLSIRGNLDASSKNRDRAMFYSVDKCGFVPHPPKKQWSIGASADPDSPREMPDVETPCRSPLPEERQQAEGELREARQRVNKLRPFEEFALKIEKAKALPFTGFTKPPIYGKAPKGKVGEAVLDPFAKPYVLEKPLSKEDIAQLSYVLMTAIGDNCEAKEAFMKLMTWRGQLGFEAGHSQGIRAQLARLARQAAEVNNRDSPP